MTVNYKKILGLVLIGGVSLLSTCSDDGPIDIDDLNEQQLNADVSYENLVAYYSFDSRDLTDESENGNHLHSIGEVTSLDDGDNSYIQILGGLEENFITTSEEVFDWSYPFSVSIWLNPQDLSTVQGVMSAKVGENQFALGILTGGRIALQNREIRVATLSDYLTEGQWTHVALVVKSQTQFKLYVNGEVVAIKYFPWIGGMNEEKSLYLGRTHTEHPDNNYAGFLDEVSIWSRYLNSAEVNELRDSTSDKVE